MNTSILEDALPFLRLYLPFVFAIGSIFYFAPCWIGRYKSSFWSIFVLNFLFGWTVFGWLIALIWSVTPDQPKRSSWRPELTPDSQLELLELAQEQPQEPETPTNESEGVRTVLVGAALSILAVAILFAVFSRGQFPLSLSYKAAAPQVAAAD